MNTTNEPPAKPQDTTDAAKAPVQPAHGTKRHPLVPLVTPEKHALKAPYGALGHRPSHMR